jgi:hypothetical protein
MSNDILTLQSETAKRHIEFAIQTEFQNLFYSWCWERVLKAELDFWDCMTILIFRKVIIKIWSGATEVFIKQNSKKCLKV